MSLDEPKPPYLQDCYRRTLYGGGLKVVEWYRGDALVIRQVFFGR